MGDPNSDKYNPKTWVQGVGKVAGQVVNNLTKREHKNNGQLRKLREDKLNVLRRMKKEDLVWEAVALSQPALTINSLFNISFQAPVIIEVCQVVKVDGLYLPVKAVETWEFARQFNAFPLTRAVADAMFLQATPTPPAPHEIKVTDDNSDSGYAKSLDFEMRSDYLGSKNYTGVADFGAHKIWALSKQKDEICQASPNEAYCRTDKDRIAINHGLYFKNGKPHAGTLLYLHGSKYGAIQNIGAKHGDDHWDYSQLLQLMRGVVQIPFKDKSGNTTMMDMETALLNGHPSLWDEPQKLTEADLNDFSSLGFMIKNLKARFSGF